MPKPRRRARRDPKGEAKPADAQPSAADLPRLAVTARKLGTHALVSMLLAAGHFAAVQGDIRSHRDFHVDEYGWLAASDSTFKTMFLDRRSGPEKWAEGFQVTTYGAMNPNFAKLIMGFALYCWGYDLEPPSFFPALGTGKPTWPELTEAQRHQVGRPYMSYIARMRWLILCMSAACAVAVYFVGRTISGPILGVCAYLAFAFTPLVKFTSSTVYPDNLLILMTLLCILMTASFARWWSDTRSCRSMWRTLTLLLATAAVFGATIATKFNGVTVCTACALFAVALWVSGRFKHHRAWKTPVLLAGVGLIAFAVFVLLNPQLHEDIPGRIAWSMRRWKQLLAHFQDIFGPVTALTNIEERLDAVFRKAVLGAGPFAYVLPAGAPVLIGLGFVLACRRWIRNAGHGGDIAGPAVLVVWTVVVVVMTTLWLPLDWPRYYLPYVPVFCLLQALPVESAARLLIKRWRPGRPAHAES